MSALDQLGQVSRSIRSLEYEGRPARCLAVQQVYPTDLDDLWDAVTSADRINRWFLPVSGDLRTGGQYSLAGNASGTVLSCDPPRGYRITWEFGGEITWVEVSLAPSVTGTGTTFTLEHIAHVDESRWSEFGPGAVGMGWDSGLLGLALYLTSGESMDPAEAMAWMQSAEGKAFLTTSSEGWRQADVDFGTDPELASAAAARCLAAYTGEPTGS
jgi:uncharacterized protein YndB with AHSA1/START domain